MMLDLKKVIAEAQSDFQNIFKTELAKNNFSLTKKQYVGFLSYQYHLTQGVQKYFYSIAGNPLTKHHKSLRTFLIKFAQEEEDHFLIAEKDLHNMNEKVIPPTIDIKLWWAYFNSILETHPFIRLGATCILENISSGFEKDIKAVLMNSKFLTPKNSVFITIHMHGENLPHGSEILSQIESASLSENEWHDLLEGSRIAAAIYLRLFTWALKL